MQYSIVNFSEVQLQTNARLDAEYWHPEAIEISKTVGTGMTLGSCIKEGYRVVYENTEILKTDEAKQMNLPKFIQATDINSPMINIENAGYVCEEDWQRYPKGRIKKGEILLEVKGDVKKVAIVPDDFPDKVLVSGTLYKFSVNENINKYFLAIYLSCSYGQRLKDRLVSNIATPFINKDELYTIPVPCLDKRIQSEIEKTYALAVNKQRTSQDIYTQAQNLLLSEIGLDSWRPRHQLTFVKNYSDTQQAERIDAEFYQPKYEEIEETIKTYANGYTFIKDEFRQNKTTFKIDIEKVYHYVEIGDVNVTNGEIIANEVTGEDLPANAKRVLGKGDVIISKVRTYRGAITIVDKNGYIGSGAFCVLQENGRINKETLLAFLHSKPLLAWSLKPNTGTSYPVIVDDDILNLPVPILPEEKQIQIQQKVVESFNLRKQSRHLLECAKRAVEIAIEQDEQTAIDYLENDAQ